MFQIETISAKMLDYYVERSDAVIIDLRDSAAYRRGHVRNAVNIPYRELEEYLEKKQDQKYRFPKDKLLILYCDRGGASMQALITAGTNSAAEKADFIFAANKLLTATGGPGAAPTYVALHEIPAESWGYDGETQAARKAGRLIGGAA